jgi:hypothetical protein
MLKKHRDNLTKLANYLDALPKDYKDFDMCDFNYDSDQSLDIADRRYDCGTAACAVGHGPAAGIRVYKDADWFAYCERAFGITRYAADHDYDEDKDFEYLFGSGWGDYDNTPHGAAARIRTYLELGGKVPEGWVDKRSAAL